jgi:hypothetical protein
MGREAEGVRMENPMNEKGNTKVGQRLPHDRQGAQG